MPSVKMTLSSGQTVSAKKVMLYPKDLIVEIALLKANAMSKLGGVSSGIGFLGSPGWAIGGALALGAITSALSSGMKKEGMEMLEEAEELYLSMKKQGFLADVSGVKGIERPIPKNWIAVNKGKIENKRIDLVGLDKNELSKICADYRLHRDEVYETGFLAPKLKVRFVDVAAKVHEDIVCLYDDDQFICFETESGTEWVRWSDVVSYRLS